VGTFVFVGEGGAGGIVWFVLGQRAQRGNVRLLTVGAGMNRRCDIIGAIMIEVYLCAVP